MSVPSRSNTKPRTLLSASTGCSDIVFIMASVALYEAVGRCRVASQGSIHIAHPPRQHFLSVFQHDALIGSIAGDIIELSRVRLKVEEQWIALGEMNILVVVILYDG